MSRPAIAATVCIILVLSLSQTCISQTLTAPMDGWIVGEQRGYYAQNGDTLHLWSNGGANPPKIEFWKAIAPAGDFSFSLQVKAQTNESCGIWVRSSMDSSTMKGFNFEFGNYGRNVFLLVKDYHGWEATEVALGDTHVWYTMQLDVKQSPFQITASVYDDKGTHLGSVSTSEINFGFDDIKYVGLGVWGYSPSDYSFRNIQYSTDEAAGSNLSINAQSSTTTAGATVNVYGTLTSGQGEPLQNKTVVLSYTFSGLDSYIPISSAATDDQGRYSIQWINSASGTFTLKVQWKGDQENLGVSNSTTLSFLPTVDQRLFVFESNSTVTTLSFDNQTATLTFNVTGPAGTNGYVRATIAKSILANSENLQASIDGKQLSYMVTSVGDSWMYDFNYHHSTHQISMRLAESDGAVQPAGNEVILAILVIVLSVTLGLIAYSVTHRGRREVAD